MIRAIQSRLFMPFTACAAVLAFAEPMHAAWLVIKNDSKQAIVVQETVIVNGKVKRGKPTNLLPGETVREYIPGPTMKTIDLFNPQRPRQALWSGQLNCPDETQTFSISGVGDRVKVQPIHPQPSKK
jgi:uncharacterized membrane protein